MIRENFTFFQKRNIFKYGIHVRRWKKIAKKIYTFFPYTKISKQKYSRKAKFGIKFFAKYINSQTSNTKEIRENIVKTISGEIFSWKEKFSPKKNDNKNFTKKKLVENNFRKENFSKKKNSKNIFVKKFF